MWEAFHLSHESSTTSIEAAVEGLVKLGQQFSAAIFQVFPDETLQGWSLKTFENYMGL